MAKLESQHQDIIEELLKTAEHERQKLSETSKDQQDHLKTIIYEQKATANIKSKNIEENYQKKKEDLTSTVSNATLIYFSDKYTFFFINYIYYD